MQLTDVDPVKKRELKRKYRNPPTSTYRLLRIVRIGCLLLALVCACFAMPFSPFGESFSMVFVIAGNILVVAAIVIDATKMRTLREEYINEILNRNSKENRRAQKAARKEEREKKEQKGPSIEEMLNDDSLGYWEKVKLRARLSAQAAQESPRVK